MNCINKNDLLFSRDAVSTKPFASLEQRIRVRANGTIGGKVVNLTILTIDANGNESPAAAFDLESNNGHFSLDHAIDPIYMLVYHNAHKLRISLEAKALEINNFSVFEEAVSSNEENISFQTLLVKDNINNPRKVEAFKNTCGRFVELIKEKCPKARIIWVYGWYNKELCVKPILEACEKWRVESVDVSALMIPENQAAKGQTYIKADGTTAPAPDGWLSHPGNTGMYRIAVKLLKKIGL